MGITTDAVLACLEALSMWGDIDFYDMNEVADVIDEIGLSAENAGKKAINVSALTDQLITLGKTDKEIYDILTGLQDLDGVVLLDAEGSIDGLTNSLTKQFKIVLTHGGVLIMIFKTLTLKSQIMFLIHLMTSLTMPMILICGEILTSPRLIT